MRSISHPRILQQLAITTVVRSLLAMLFLAAGAAVIQYNVREVLDNPTLGTNYVYSRRAELIRQIEGISNPSKQEMINLAMGDGMRFFHFLGEHLPEDTVLIFPRDEVGYLEPTRFFRMGFGAIKARLYPRKIQREFYDFQSPPYDPLDLSDVPQEYQLVTRDYVHSSRHFVFQLFFSPEAKRYRFSFASYPAIGQPNYHTINLFIMYPEASDK